MVDLQPHIFDARRAVRVAKAVVRKSESVIDDPHQHRPAVRAGRWPAAGDRWSVHGHRRVADLEAPDQGLERSLAQLLEELLLHPCRAEGRPLQPERRRGIDRRYAYPG